MCSRPITQDGQTFACRTCDDCISTRRASWVSRAMAEKAMHKHALCIALTYGNDTQEQRDAAKMFCYADVRAFLARLRSDLRRRYAGNYTLRFLCAGEQGDRNGRCHWHLILYSDRDLTKSGTFKRHGRVVSDRSGLITVGKNKIRLDWSIWGQGFVTLQEPDQGGMNYVLSYCLKDQFIAQKSRDTMREAKSENFATGLFRMSKRPAIGSSWLLQKMQDLEAKGAVLPNLQLKIPEMSGYWYPNGLFREKLLWYLVALNQRVVWATGANAPQWSALLHSCSENEKDLEILNGKEIPEETTIEFDIEVRNREAERRSQDRKIVATCANIVPCLACLNSLSEADLRGFGVGRAYCEETGRADYHSLPGYPSFEERKKTRGEGLNPYCQQKGNKGHALLFPVSGSISDSGH